MQTDSPHGARVEITQDPRQFRLSDPERGLFPAEPLALALTFFREIRGQRFDTNGIDHRNAGQRFLLVEHFRKGIKPKRARIRATGHAGFFPGFLCCTLLWRQAINGPALGQNPPPRAPCGHQKNLHLFRFYAVTKRCKLRAHCPFGRIAKMKWQLFDYRSGHCTEPSVFSYLYNTCSQNASLSFNFNERRSACHSDRGVHKDSRLEPTRALSNSAGMMKPLLWIKSLALALCWIPGANADAPEPLRVFAAASLQGPLDTIARDWPAQVVVSYAGSGTLARQVSQGAPADVVILANSVWMDWLVERRDITAPVTDIVSNRLVLIGPAAARALPNPDPQALLDRLAGGRLAMGQHLSVPAGIYARAWLEHIDAWAVLRPHLAETDNVRAALFLVARGEVPLGVVYASDAFADARVFVLWTIPDDQHPTIRYPAAALTDRGAAFLGHLGTRTDAFVGAGFTALP